jgi:hypothetical protein
MDLDPRDIVSSRLFMRSLIAAANEENFDRLETHLGRS